MLKISSTSHNIIEMEKQIQVAVPKKKQFEKKKIDTRSSSFSRAPH
jgi:hypothetical protein